MTKKSILGFLTLMVLILITGLHTVFAESLPPMTQPRVARRVIVCDMWQWIGHGNTTWGCLHTPREVLLAEGQTSDAVIKSLQEQINQLEARLKKLEER